MNDSNLTAFAVSGGDSLPLLVDVGDAFVRPPERQRRAGLGDALGEGEFDCMFGNGARPKTQIAVSVPSLSEFVRQVAVLDEHGLAL